MPDCARYIATTILCLCAPAPPRTRAEYKSQFPASAPDVGTQVRVRVLSAAGLSS